MSDVSKTSDLVTEARSGKYLTPGERYELIDRLADALADALEAATRVPVQGEPNDDRGFLVDLIREHDLAADEHTSPRDYRAGLALGILAAGFSRATVPDAAFEKAEEDRRYWRRRYQTMHKRAKAAEAERDAATEAIDRVRAIHTGPAWAHFDLTLEEPHEKCDGCTPLCLCANVWPCPTVAALDGAPEPDGIARAVVEAIGGEGR